MPARWLRGVVASPLARRTYAACRRIPLLGSALHRAAVAVFPTGSRIWVQVPAGGAAGLWFRIDPRFEPGYLYGDHEPWLQELLRTELRAGDCFYDVGAHTGFLSLVAARAVGPAGHVVAFEPDPDNLAELRANLARNELSHVTVVAAAAWSRPEELIFRRANPASNRTEGRVVEGIQGPGIRVRATRLDDVVFAEGRRPPDLVKMDIEGAEWEALQGGRRLFEEHRPRLFCEVHLPEQIATIEAWLEARDYTVEHWTPTHARQPDARQRYLWATPRRPAGPAIQDATTR